MQLWKEKFNFIIRNNEGKGSAKAELVHPILSLQNNALSYK